MNSSQNLATPFFLLHYETSTFFNDYGNMGHMLHNLKEIIFNVPVYEKTTSASSSQKSILETDLYLSSPDADPFDVNGDDELKDPDYINCDTDDTNNNIAEVTEEENKENVAAKKNRKRKRKEQTWKRNVIKKFSKFWNILR